MKIALAAMIRAAEGLRKAHKPVSATTIAKVLDVPTKSVESYVESVVGFKKDLGIDEEKSKTCNESGKYRVAIRRLCESGLIITYSRIARLAKSSQRATKNWCLRHPEVMREVPIVSEHVLNQHCLRQRIRWFVRMHAPRREKITVTGLAHAMDKDRTAMQHLFKENPDFRKELGI